MVPALFVAGLILLLVPMLIWRSRSRRLRRRRSREEQELRSRGFDVEGIRQIQQLRGRGRLLSTGDTVLLVLLALGLIVAIDFPITGPFLVLVVAATVIRGAVKNAKRQERPSEDTE